MLICLIFRNIIIKNNDKISKLLLKQVKLKGGNYLDENEINNIIKINNDKDLIKKILINQEFSEFEDDDDEDDDFDKIMEKRNQKIIINEKDNDKIKGSILINKNEIISYDKNYFVNIEKNLDNINVEENFNNDFYYYDINLIELLIEILNISNNLNPIFFKCITEIILSLVSKNKDDYIISFASPRIISKIEKIYISFKENIISKYKKNKRFSESGYIKFQQQYKSFLSLVNFDFDEIIKEGFIILNKNLLNFNSFKLEHYQDIIINNKQYLKNNEDLLSDNIINFFIIHDFYYILSNERNKTNIHEIKDLFINKYPLIFDELNFNEQYLLCDLNSQIKYFSCKCRINKQKNNSNNYFDCTVLIYENQIYFGNSSSNPNYTRIVEKYQISNCSLKFSENIKNCINLFFPEDKNNYIIVELVFSDTELLYQKMNIIKEEINNSLIKEKKKFEDFLYNIK